MWLLSIFRIKNIFAYRAFARECEARETRADIRTPLMREKYTQKTCRARATSTDTFLLLTGKASAKTLLLLLLLRIVYYRTIYTSRLPHMCMWNIRRRRVQNQKYHYKYTTHAQRNHHHHIKHIHINSGVRSEFLKKTTSRREQVK